MSLMHCPLCVGLAVLSVFRAGAHLLMVGLRLTPERPQGMDRWAAVES